MNFSLRSSAFAANGAIPALYTCEGSDISPPLAWSNAPSAPVASAHLRVAIP